MNLRVEIEIFVQFSVELHRSAAIDTEAYLFAKIVRGFMIGKYFAFHQLDKRAHHFQAAHHVYATNVDIPVGRLRRGADFNAAADLSAVARHRKKRAVLFASPLAFNLNNAAFKRQ